MWLSSQASASLRDEKGESATATPRGPRTRSGRGPATPCGLGWRIAERHERRIHAVEDDGPIDDTFANVGATREVVHHVEEHFFQDGPQTAGTRAPQERLFCDCLEGIFRELELDAVVLEVLLVLLDERVLGLD